MDVGRTSQELFKCQLRSFYRRKDPSKLVNIDTIVEKYAGKQKKLWQFLRKKYNIEEELPYPVDTQEGDRKPSQSTDGRRVTRSERLDFCGEHFDPTLALQQSIDNIFLPCAHIRALDNIHKCRILLPDSDNDHKNVSIIPRNQHSANRTQLPASNRAEPSAKSGQKQRYVGVSELRHVLAKRVGKGPLELLKRCMSSRKKLRVWYRRKNGIRGTITGVLFSFDKHMNLILVNAREDFTCCNGLIWIPRDAGGRRKSKDGAIFENQSGSPPSHVSARMMRTLKRQPMLQHHVRRFLKQLFIRGDCVVMCAIVQ